MDLWIAFSLVLVIEGLLPALAPGLFRRVLSAMAQMDEHALRRSGLLSMVLGAALLYLFKQ